MKNYTVTQTISIKATGASGAEKLATYLWLKTECLANYADRYVVTFNDNQKVVDIVLIWNGSQP